MDLIEARPPKFNLFSGLPFVCNAEGIDCLDCPKCGFTTTTADYQYLRLCKSDREGKGMFVNSRTSSDLRRRDSERSRMLQSGHRRNCSFCQALLESSSWQFCPTCGKQCSPPTPVLSSSNTPDDMNEIIRQPKIPSDVIIADGSDGICKDDTEPDNQEMEMQKDSKPIEKGIVRTVTPPKQTSMNTDNIDPMQMQY